jgi:hypothetical protein
MGSKAMWSVLVTFFFAIGTWATPIPDRWKPYVVSVSWIAFLLSCFGWLVAHFSSTGKWKPTNDALTLTIVGCVGAAITIGVWVLASAITTAAISSTATNSSAEPTGGQQSHAEGTVVNPPTGQTTRGTGTTAAAPNSGIDKGGNTPRVPPGIILAGKNARAKNIRVENGTLEVKPSAENPRLEGVTVDNKSPVSSILPFGPPPLYPPAPENANAVHAVLTAEEKLLAMSKEEFRKLVAKTAREMKEFEQVWTFYDKPAIEAPNVIDPDDPKADEKRKENVEYVAEETQRRKNEDAERVQALRDDFQKKFADFHSIYEELAKRCQGVPPDPLPNGPESGKVTLAAKILEEQARKCLN